MKLNRYILLLTFSLLVSCFAYAQGDKGRLSGIKATTVNVAKKQGKEVNVDFIMDLTDMPRLGRNVQMEIVPVLVSNISEDRLELPIFVITGSTRGIMLERNMRASASHPYQQPGNEPLAIIRRHNGKAEQFHYATKVPFARWMKNASLLLKSKNTGCAGCLLGEEQLALTSEALVPLYVPQYKYASIVPEGELQKHREESLTAHINFIVAKHDIVPGLADNARELKKVETKVGEMMSDESITIKKLSFQGYASPEGTVDFNLDLSRRRVESFVNYVVVRFPKLKGRYTSEAMGQDWKGLREVVSAGNLADKDEILNIIDNTPAAQRNEELKRLGDGSTYAHLLREVYPPLRRSVVTFSFIVKGFDLEEAKEVMKVHPNRLSLAEYKAVADSYGKGSPEEYATWVTAATAFPELAVPAINVAVLDLEAGRYAQAVRFLEAYKDNNPQLWGILGLAYAYNEQYQEAQKYLSWALQHKVPDAEYNLQEFLHFMEDNF